MTQISIQQENEYINYNNILVWITTKMKCLIHTNKISLKDYTVFMQSQMQKNTLHDSIYMEFQNR